VSNTNTATQGVTQSQSAIAPAGGGYEHGSRSSYDSAPGYYHAAKKAKKAKYARKHKKYRKHRKHRKHHYGSYSRRSLRA
jgi:hypothetical protein